MAKREQVVAEELKNQQLAQEVEKEVGSIAQDQVTMRVRQGRQKKYWHSCMQMETQPEAIRNNEIF
ncbi:hypothetical protein PAECIP111890_05744 [Paenibacillus sp. JJ-223]|nr:hypothetical protein PAECIP111890_05744 [Paenibacillus sp. JJ-223]